MTNIIDPVVPVNQFVASLKQGLLLELGGAPEQGVGWYVRVIARHQRLRKMGEMRALYVVRGLPHTEAYKVFQNLVQGFKHVQLPCYTVEWMNCTPRLNDVL